VGIVVTVNLSSYFLSYKSWEPASTETSCRRHEIAAQVLTITSGNISGFIRSRKIPMHRVETGHDCWRRRAHSPSRARDHVGYR